MESSTQLSLQEVDGLFRTLAGETLGSVAERRRANRSPFPMTQWLGPYREWGLPKKDMFCEVRCHDLSAGGVSFFWPRPPAFEFAVIGLGKQPNITYLLTRVTHSREIEVDGKKRFLVGCRFLQRVTIEG